MKKYNIQNYVRYKNDVKKSMPEDKAFSEYTRDELIIKFMPLVENLARKFSTSDQASGILSINDLIQIGNEGLVKSVDRLDWTVLKDSQDIEKTLKSFISKRVMSTIYLSQEGYDNLKTELQNLKSVDRPRVINQISEARDKGDLSENAALRFLHPMARISACWRRLCSLTI